MHKIEPGFSSSSVCASSFFDDAACSFLQKIFSNGFNIEAKLESFSNENWKIQEPSGNAWVVRIPTRIAHSLCHQSQEKAVLDWAFREGFSLLEVAGYAEKEGYLLTPFLSGRSCSKLDFQTPVYLREALDLLSRLHISKTAPIEVQFDPLARYTATVQQALEEGIVFEPEVHEIAGELRGFLTHMSNRCFYMLPCHNDPSPENFFCQDGRLYLHDWELARRNDPMWDLAHFSVIAEVEPEILLSLYPTSDPLAREKILFFQPFVVFNTAVWGALERAKLSPGLSKERVELLYRTFLGKSLALIKSELFQVALKKLI